jgi:Fe-S-cluster containining protein
MRRLSVLVERSVADVKAIQIQTSSDHEQKVRQGGPVTCSKGCSHCCHHPFLITLVEGLLLYRHLKSQSLWTSSLRARLGAAQDRVAGLAMEVWMLSNIPCALLSEGCCLGYNARPLHCRTTFARGDPYRCHPHELDGDFVPNTELIARYTEDVGRHLRRIGVIPLLMPLPAAVLLGESVDLGEIAIEDAARTYVRRVRG